MPANPVVSELRPTATSRRSGPRRRSAAPGVSLPPRLRPSMSLLLLRADHHLQAAVACPRSTSRLPTSMSLWRRRITNPREIPRLANIGFRGYMRAKIVRKCNLRHALNLRFNLSPLALFAGHGGHPHTPSTTPSHAAPINTPGVGFICAGGVWY